MLATWLRIDLQKVYVSHVRAFPAFTVESDVRFVRKPVFCGLRISTYLHLPAYQRNIISGGGFMHGRVDGPPNSEALVKLFLSVCCHYNYGILNSVGAATAKLAENVSVEMTVPQGDWKCGSGKCDMGQNARVEIAGVESVGVNSRGATSLSSTVSEILQLFQCTWLFVTFRSEFQTTSSSSFEFEFELARSPPKIFFHVSVEWPN